MKRTVENTNLSVNGAAGKAAGETAAPESALASVQANPSVQLDGIEEFGNLKNWVSFDAPRGKLVCKTLDTEYEEFQAVIVESKAVRVMKDEDGNVLCSSSDRMTADSGRIGRECASCEDKDEHCFPRWWLAWQDGESGLLFAHTLSTTASYNFTRYATALQREKRQPDEVMTRIYVEEAKRRKSGTTYRRIQFEQVESVG